jgi:hypothetical protein
MVLLTQQDVGKRIETRRGDKGLIADYLADKEYCIWVHFDDGSRCTYQKNGNYYASEVSDMDIVFIEGAATQLEDKYKGLDATEFFQRIMGRPA